jgi:hypothetical protein
MAHFVFWAGNNELIRISSKYNSSPNNQQKNAAHSGMMEFFSSKSNGPKRIHEAGHRPGYRSMCHFESRSDEKS